MANRNAFRPKALESLEARLVLNGHAAHSVGLVGTLGDSYTDEYQFYPPDRTHARNWVEILASTKQAGFGPFTTASRGEPRDQGFATNWARSDATSGDMIANQLPGLARQVAGGGIAYVSIFVGGIDFLRYLRGVAAGGVLPAPDVAAAQLAQIEATAQANLDTAVGTLLAANPNVKVVVATVPALSQAPIVRALATTPEAQALVAAADQGIAQYNAHLHAVEATNPRVALSDLAAATAIVAGAGGGGSSVPFGGTTISLTTSSNDYRSLVLADGLHVGTVAQGVVADNFLQAIHVKFAARVRILSQPQIVALAALVQLRTRNLR